MPDNQFTPKGFLVWGICAVFFLYEFSLRITIGTYQHPIMQDLGLTSFEFSLLSTTLFSLMYGIMQIPVGLIVDHIGLKKSLLIGATLCTIACLGFAHSYHYTSAIVYRMLMGIGASFGFISLLMAVHDWMPQKNSALFIGLSQFIGTLGPMAVAGPLSSLSQSSQVSWHFIFLLLGIIGIILTLLIFLFVENNSQKAGHYIILYQPEKISTAIIRLFSKIQPWCIALLSATLYFSVEYLSESEGRVFLELKNITSNSASYMIALAWVGYGIGCPLMGFLSDLLERRKTVIIFSSLLGLIAILMILYLSSELFLQIAFLLLGLSASGQSIAFATIAEQFKKQFIAVGFALNNALITLIVAINAPAIGLLLDYTKKGPTVSLSEYLWVFNVLILLSVISIIIAVFFLKETFCKSRAEFTVLKTKSAS